MTLREIKSYMMSSKLASLATLCKVFQSDELTMRCFLNHWMVKGCIRQCAKKSGCGTACAKCPQAAVEWYEWVDKLGYL